MATRDRIESLLKHIGKNAKQFADSVGVTPTQIYDLRSGKTKNITEGIADKILSKYSDYSKSWLMTGEGSMYRIQSNNSVVREDPAEYLGDSFNNRLLELINKGDYYPAYIVKEKNKRIEELIEEVGRLKYEIAELKKGRAKMEGDAS